MPLTAIDSNTVLIVIDLQKGIVAMPTATPSSEIVAKAATLAKAFRAKGLPVVWVNVEGSAPGRTESPKMPQPWPTEFSELVPELGAQATDLYITKYRFGAFTTTDLDDELQARGITQIVLCGISTSIGVESTGRVGQELGYNVVFVVDAMTDRIAEAHANSVERIFPRIGETCTMDELLKLLA